MPIIFVQLKKFLETDHEFDDLYCFHPSLKLSSYVWVSFKKETVKILRSHSSIYVVAVVIFEISIIQPLGVDKMYFNVANNKHELATCLNVNHIFAKKKKVKLRSWSLFSEDLKFMVSVF